MPYIALRPCRFDRPYFIGETIPDEVVDPARAEGLISMGRIQRTFAQESGESGAELQGADSAPEGGDTGEDEKDAEKPAEAKAAIKKTSAKK